MRLSHFLLLADKTKSTRTSTHKTKLRLVFVLFQMLPLERFRTIAFIALSVFGCAGNLLTLIVISQRFFRKTASAAFIFGLCFADCVVLCLHTFQIIARDHPRITTHECFIIFLIDVFRLFSIWIVCFINIERCSLVFNPCHMPRLTSRRKSCILVCLLFLVAVLIFSHYAQHMYTAHVSHVDGTNATLFYCAFKENFHDLLWVWIKLTLTYGLTVPLCTICNIIIIIQLHRASRIERISPGNRLDLSSKQRQLTAMLVASSIGFVLTATPTALHSIYITIKQNKNLTQYTIHIINSTLLHFHHASNFLVFVFSSGRFRLEVIRLFHHYFPNSFCTISFSCYRRPLSSHPQCDTTKPTALYTKNGTRTPVKLFVVKRRSRRPITTKQLSQKNRRHYEPCLSNYYK